ncbi:MAG: hypothetical protein ABFD96_23870 [Armatimonadia bacterium]
MAKAIVFLLTCLVSGMACGQQLDLKDAKVIADRGTWGSAVPVPELVDGKAETSWNSGMMDLRMSPANVFVIFEKPVVVGELELETVVSKDALRVTDFEVYGRVGKGWMLLGKMEKQTQTIQRMALRPVETSQLRIRIRDNQREGHAWAVVAELRLFAPAAGTVAEKGVARPVPDETSGERMFVAAALGELPTYPKAKYDPQKGYLFYVKSFLDTMRKNGTDQYGPVKSPMFASILMLEDGKHPQSVIPSMPGQRIGDRALFGGNLQHDLPLLMAMAHFGRIIKDWSYGRAASNYLVFFMNNCTNTPTGLWPWGEHAHWDFFKETWGHTYHEYLGAPPLDFLEVAWQMNPKAVQGEADGMLNHVRDFETYQFCRHAEIDKPLTEPRQADRKGLDFPRHGAMFLRHWAFTYSKTKDPKYLGYVEGMLKHFELTRLKDGFLPILSQFSDRPALAPNGGCNLSVGVCLLEAAPLLAGTPAGEHTKKLGTELLETLAAAPVKVPAKAVFGMVYGGSEFQGGDAALRVQAYRLTKDPRHLEAAIKFAEVYAPVDAMPTEGNIRAQVYGVLVDLFLDLDELDKDPKWLAAAEKYARFGIEDLYCNGLFRGASNLGYYDSELYVSTFVYALVRLQARLDGGKEKVEALYFHR